MRVALKDMQDAEGRIRDFVRSQFRLPLTCQMVDMDTGISETVSQEHYCGMFYNYYIFWLREGRFPNFVTRNISKDSPMILDHQNNAYQCGPCSMSMVSTKLFKPMKEGTMGLDGLAKLLRTTKESGTAEQNFIDYLPDAGFVAWRIERNPTAVTNALKKYHGVLIHYQTGPADCSGFYYDYGHWAVAKDVVNGKYIMWDPTRGIFTCPCGEMDRATNGRNIKYLEIALR